MKALTPHNLNSQQARKEWHLLKALLASKPSLDERKDILPFFSKCYDLSLLISYYYPAIRNPDVIAHKFPLGGDFKADLVVGDSKAHEYVLVEFEDASAKSLFSGSRAKRDWSKRFEGAFSQLVDWIYKIEDMRVTDDFSHTFGNRKASFHGLIVIGKGLKLSTSEQARLRWRVEHIMVDSKRVEIKSFDDLLDDMDFWLSKYRNV
ncbi:hypothetical protein HK16_05855 [Acetobacter senegalensis]|uniref:Shedu protein SduA C-terminal domain-containing protein n=2 Tax=Acetobacter TaxID=434 RepID=A0A252EL98_9PROT|nr:MULTISPECIES: Shedu immune nuclease family protein [Acetobacter]ATJ91536.1 DUF4263 domain-containing protein [Acetobacter tropicalis]OUL67072.1 hypothetical protein HK16_05855 [Acetobacter senegalensis]